MTYIMADHPYTFPLDDFQTRAINAIGREENVLVTAKTGSGKTLVGEYQIWRYEHTSLFPGFLGYLLVCLTRD